MTNEELMRIYTADPDNAEDALVQLYEQNMDLIWDIARNSAKAFNCLNATQYSQNILEDLASGTGSSWDISMESTVIRK